MKITSSYDCRLVMLTDKDEDFKTVGKAVFYESDKEDPWAVMAVLSGFIANEYHSHGTAKDGQKWVFILGVGKAKLKLEY